MTELVHGWKDDGSGQCVEQPAEKDTFASKIRIPSEPQWRVVPEVRAVRTGLDIEVTAVREGVERKTYYRFPNLMHITMFLDPGDPATECHHFLWHVPIDDLNSMFVSSTAVPDALLPRLKETRGAR